MIFSVPEKLSILIADSDVLPDPLAETVAPSNSMFMTPSFPPQSKYIPYAISFPIYLDPASASIV